MLARPAEEKRIRTGERPCCTLCGSTGRPLYVEQQDRLFGAAGRWDLKQCPERDCGLVWLDPMPLAQDLFKAYDAYYTHAASNENSRGGLPRRLYRRMKSEYLTNEYHYRLSRGTLGRWFASGLLYLLPFGRADADADVRHLPAVPQGRLLDVGCGTGEWLSWMRGLGWEVEGVDFDPGAVRVARENGLAVGCGTLEEQRYPDNSFEAVTLNHVIEHVPAPVQTLAECARILKPGGTLFLATPNTRALGHRMFARHWRGLEVPRHLHLFCPPAMERLLAAAGFVKARIKTLNSAYIWRETLALQARFNKTSNGKHGLLRNRLTGAALALLEQAWLLVQPEAGECLAVLAHKNENGKASSHLLHHDI